MAIQVNGTEVISNSRALNNIASADATTVATLNSAGVGGGGIAYGSTYVPISADYGQGPSWAAYDASEDKFVATDHNTNYGASWYSTDGTGKTWVENSLDSDIGYCRAGIAASGSGTFVAACNSGKIARSTNLGQSWTSVAPSYSSAGGAGGDWQCIAYGNGVFMGGYREYIFRSTNDGVSWSQPTNPAPVGYAISSAANDGGNNWLATSYDRLLRSTDNGATWTDLGQKPTPGGVKNFYQIAYGNGFWVIGGQSGWIGSSTDNGSTWTYKQVHNTSFAGPSAGTYGPGGFLFSMLNNKGGFVAGSGSYETFLLQGSLNHFNTSNLYSTAQNTTTKAAVLCTREQKIMVRYET